MKFGQLIEHNMRNTFLKNHTQDVVEKLFPDSFRKSRNLVYLWISSLKFYAVCLYNWPSCYQNILKLNCRSHAFTSYKVFLKNKRRSGTSLIFCMIFEGKYLSFCILLIDQISLCGSHYFLRYWPVCVL